jgi:hypothetical protein
MNLFHIIEQLSAVDPDVLDRFDSRRAVFNSLGTVAKRTAMAASPLFLGALFQKAYAGTASVPVDILNYALTLELLEADFYRQLLAAGTVPSGADDAAIRLIKSHEDAHVTFLTTAILSTGGTPVVGTATTGIRFKASALPATYAAQLSLAQQLEDIGVRAYKGRAAELTGTDLLTTALQIHSVEARHAAQIRLMRGQLPWVNNADDLTTAPAYTSGVVGATTTAISLSGGSYGIPSYSATKPSALETNVLQGATSTQPALNIPTAFGTTPPYPYAPEDAAAAFDEALQAAEVLDMSRAGGLLA